MLPSKCPLCNKDLLIPMNQYRAYCSEKEEHYRYAIYPNTSRGVMCIEMFFIGRYEISNHISFNPPMTSFSKDCAVYDRMNALKRVLFLNEIRITPTITEEKIRKYIAFS